MASTKRIAIYQSVPLGILPKQFEIWQKGLPQLFSSEVIKSFANQAFRPEDCDIFVFPDLLFDPVKIAKFLRPSQLAQREPSEEEKMECARLLKSKVVVTKDWVIQCLDKRKWQETSGFLHPLVSEKSTVPVLKPPPVVATTAAEVKLPTSVIAFGSSSSSSSSSNSSSSSSSSSSSGGASASSSDDVLRTNVNERITSILLQIADLYSLSDVESDKMKKVTNYTVSLSLSL